MGRRRSIRLPKEKSRKKVNVTLVAREHAGRVVSVYEILERLVEKHHSHLVDAKIAIAWRFGWKANTDGHVTLGQAKKGSDLDRELHGYDFVILLNHEAVNKGSLKQPQIKALIDHELCHCQVSKDSNGETKTDENGRTVYRIRKHDVEEFREIVARHGLWKDDLESFAASIREKSARPLLPDDDDEHAPTLPMGAPAGGAQSAAARKTSVSQPDAPETAASEGESPAKKSPARKTSGRASSRTRTAATA